MAETTMTLVTKSTSNISRRQTVKSGPRNRTTGLCFLSFWLSVFGLLLLLLVLFINSATAANDPPGRRHSRGVAIVDADDDIDPHLSHRARLSRHSAHNRAPDLDADDLGDASKSELRSSSSSSSTAELEHRLQTCLARRDWRRLMRSGKYRDLPSEYLHYEEKFKDIYRAQEQLGQMSEGLKPNPLVKDSSKKIFTLTLGAIKKCLKIKIWQILAGLIKEFPKECCLLDVFKIVPKCREMQPTLKPPKSTTTKRPSKTTTTSSAPTTSDGPATGDNDASTTTTTTTTTAAPGADETTTTVSPSADADANSDGSSTTTTMKPGASDAADQPSTTTVKPAAGGKKKKKNKNNNKKSSTKKPKKDSDEASSDD